jgi:hypothetical protein
MVGRLQINEIRVKCIDVGENPRIETGPIRVLSIPYLECP